MDTPGEAQNEFKSPFDQMLGMRVTSASAERCTAELDVRPDHHQPYGIVHGGVYASMIEATCSIGASVWAASTGNGTGAMGVSNHTDFLRSASEGALHCDAVRVQSGGTLQLWEAAVTDGEGTLIAHGRVRLMNLKPRD